LPKLHVIAPRYTHIPARIRSVLFLKPTLNF
jgi:hypothetical protein